MHAVHVLRKLNAAEWGGTEMAIHRLITGLSQHQIGSTVYCPRVPGDNHGPEPLSETGCAVKRFKACLPLWGISREEREGMIAVGGNLMSFDLIRALWRETDASLIHTHTLGRLGGVALTIAKRRKLPFVVTIHGGVYDIPDSLKTNFRQTAQRGWDWGKILGVLLQSRRLFVDADAIITCNAKEAALVQQQVPGRRVLVQPHGVPAKNYQPDHREAARQAYPQTAGRQVLLSVGRIDPVKNQRWLVEEAPALFARHPKAMMIFAGACTNEEYGAAIRKRITELGMEDRIVLTGGLPPTDPRLIGLMQLANVILLPSISETFGLVILEAWAAGTSVIASRTSGACALVKPGENGWLFELNDPAAFHAAVDTALNNPGLAARCGAAGQELVTTDYDTTVLAGRMKRLYENVIEEKQALRHCARRRHECANPAGAP